MLALGPLSFGAPLALAGLLSLPALWLLLRATPPAPKRAIFPPLRLLKDAPDDAETPHHAPWWLILFRLLIAALVILALARPVWTPPAVENDTDPALIVLDNDWSAAPAWTDTIREAERLITDAQRDGRLIALGLTTRQNGQEALSALGNADAARRFLEAARPQAWFASRDVLAAAIDCARQQDTLPDRMAVTWLSNGRDDNASRDLARSLSAMGDVRILTPEPGRAVLGLNPAEATSEGLRVTVRRVADDLPRPAVVTAFGDDGRAISRAEAVLQPGQSSVSVDMSLPLDLRNRITSLRVEGSQSAGAVQLMADMWRRPRIGLIEQISEDGQPLLSDLHYVESALAPYAETRRGTLDDLLADNPAGLVMIDDARSDDSRIADFVAGGGLLIRFAGPRLAARSDELLPVELRQGGRLFGGALNWDEPQRMADFPASSPFAGLPADPSATIDRQVLAEPGSARPDRVWARLEDGTPLVTSERRGQGWIILFHVTASPSWSDLPLSGVFPRMLQRLTGLAQGGSPTGASGGAWVIDQALSADGQLDPTPPSSARPVSDQLWAETRVTPQSPPGIYRLGSASQALNLVTPDTRFDPMPADLPGAVLLGMNGPRATHFDAALLTLALIMLTADVVIALTLAGRLSNLNPRRIMPALLLGVVALAHTPAVDAQQNPDPASDRLLDAALNLRFAYVESGDPALDATSRAGLTGLSREVWRRSAVEPIDPMAINVEADSDMLIFFPMIYWPVTENAAPLTDETAARVNAYLQGGGLIIFDTQDADVAMLRAGAPHPGLIRVLESVDVPPLARVPSDHVLTRSFYLLEDFPGRYSGEPVWVEASPDGASRDGTSGVVIGAHDWASAWAVDENGRPLNPVDGGDRQRELAQRFGVNLAMYALTGNYKADQVHIPEILERLGQ